MKAEWVGARLAGGRQDAWEWRPEAAPIGVKPTVASEPPLQSLETDESIAGISLQPSSSIPDHKAAMYLDKSLSRFSQPCKKTRWLTSRVTRR